MSYASVVAEAVLVLVSDNWIVVEAVGAVCCQQPRQTKAELGLGRTNVLIKKCIPRVSGGDSNCIEVDLAGSQYSPRKWG